MQKNHAKAIKGMSIACIALAGVIILTCLIGIAMMSAMAPFIQEAMLDSYYDYDYGYGSGYGYDSIFGQYGIGAHYGSGDFPGYYSYYDDFAAYQLAVAIVNILLGCMIVAEALVLVAGIMALRNYNKPDKFGLVFGWSIAGAVIGFLCAGVIQAVLFIIIAVFVNGDKKLYRAGLYYTGAAPAAYAAAQPVQPISPMPVQPVQPVATQPVQPAAQATQPVQPTAQATQPVQQVAASATQPVLAPAADAATQSPSPQQVQASAQGPVDGASAQAAQPESAQPETEAVVEEAIVQEAVVPAADVAAVEEHAVVPAADVAFVAPDADGVPVVDEGASVAIDEADNRPSDN